MGRPFATLPAACVLIFAAPALAGEIDVRSAIDSVTVYPDGAMVTRTLSVDLPQGDTTLIARDFPPGLDASSLRVEGETAAPVVIGSIDARAPRPERPPTAPELEKRWQQLNDDRAALEDQIGAETARKKFAERFASETPFGLGEKGEARPIADWRLAAFGALLILVLLVRRQGILDRALLRGLVQHARDTGLREVWLETGSRQGPAVALYESEGFRPIPPFGHWADHPETLCFAITLA